MIAVTGSTGFFGEKLLPELLKVHYVVVYGRRKPTCVADVSFVKFDINDLTVSLSSIKLVSLIIHCAARVHFMNDHFTNSLVAFREVNTYGLSSNTILNQEILKACRASSILASWFSVLSKYPSKLLGYLFK